MPAIAAAPLFWGTVAAAGVGAGATVYGASRQSGAMKEGAKYQASSTADALQHEREQEQYERDQYQREYERQVMVEDEERRQREEDRLLDRQRYDAEQSIDQQRFDVSQENIAANRAWDEQLYNEQQGRLRPYQEAGTGAVKQISSLLNNAPRIPVGRGTRRITGLI